MKAHLIICVDWANTFNDKGYMTLHKCGCIPAFQELMYVYEID